MNIGIFTDTYFPQINGIVTSICTLEKELIKMGHTVYIFTPGKFKESEEKENVFRVAGTKVIFLKTHRMAIAYSPKLLYKIKKLNLDVVHTHTEFPMGIFGIIVADFYKLPKIHTYHTMYEDYTHYVANGNLVTKKMAQSLSKLFCNTADIVIAPAEKTKNCLLEYGVTKEIQVVPTGLDFSPLKSKNISNEEINALKLELGLSNVEHIAVYVGRIAKEKSIDIILKAIPKLILMLPNFKLVIVGEGPYEENLKLLAKNLKIEKNVLFLGSKPWFEIGKYYKLGKVFVMASNSETQGLTYIEAMSTETLVVAKKDKCIENLILDGETGFIFDKDEDLSDVIYTALTLKNPELILQEALAIIQSMSSDIFSAKVENIYSNSIINHIPKKSKFRIKKNLTRRSYKLKKSKKSKYSK